MDTQTIYEALKDAAENYGWIGEHADEHLWDAAQTIAEDPQNA